MQQFIDVLNFLLPFLYIATFIIYAYDFGRGDDKYANSKSLFLFITLLVHISFLILRTIKFGHPPITNVFEIFTIIAFAISFSYFILELLTDIRGTGPFIIIFSVLFQIISSIFIPDKFVIIEVLKNNLLGFHVFTALLGYSAITISAVYGFLYLILYKEIKLNKFGLIFERMPNLEILEKLSFHSSVIGFALLTLAIIIGVIWLPQAFPKFSFIDPKITGTALVWILYGVGISSKVLGKWQGKKVVTLSIVGFIIAILSTLITNFISHSFHSFY